MKRLLVLIALAALGGCVVAPPGPPNYGTRAVYQQPVDPHEWHTVSVTPVTYPPGTERPVNYTSEPVPAPSTSTVVTTPVYVAQPVYVPAPVYFDPYPAYWYPPFSVSLGFVWGHGWGGGRCCYGGPHYRRH